MKHRPFFSISTFLSHSFLLSFLSHFTRLPGPLIFLRFLSFNSHLLSVLSFSHLFLFLHFLPLAPSFSPFSRFLSFPHPFPLSLLCVRFSHLFLSFPIYFSLFSRFSLLLFSFIFLLIRFISFYFSTLFSLCFFCIHFYFISFIFFIILL